MLVQGGESLWPSPPTFRYQTILSAHELIHELIHELNNKAAENFKEIFRRLLHSQNKSTFLFTPSLTLHQITIKH
jgi:hypothetical protein